MEINSNKCERKTQEIFRKIFGGKINIPKKIFNIASFLFLFLYSTGVYAASFTWNFNNPANYKVELPSRAEVGGGILRLIRQYAVKGNINDSATTSLRYANDVVVFPAISRAIVGSNEGLQVIDIADPNNPSGLTAYSGVSEIIEGYSNSAGYYVYAIEPPAGGGPDELNVYKVTGTNNEFLGKVNTITSSGALFNIKVYVTSSGTPLLFVLGDPYLEVYQIDTTNPANLTSLGSVGHSTLISDALINSLSVEAFEIGGVLYAAVGSSDKRLSIFEVSISGGSATFTHKDTLLVGDGIKGEVLAIENVGSYLYLGTQFDGALQVVDISTITNINIVKTLDIRTDYIYDLFAESNLLYASEDKSTASNGVQPWSEGLFVYDISQPNDPILIGSAAKIDNLANSYLVGPRRFVKSGNYIYMAVYTDYAFQIIDVGSYTYPSVGYADSVNGVTGINADDRDRIEHTAAAGSTGDIKYQVNTKADTTGSFYYFDTTTNTWTTTTDETQNNTASEVTANFKDSSYPSGTETGIRFILESNGSQFAGLDSVVMYYNDNPVTDINLSNTSVDENTPSGTTVGTFSAVDKDTGDTYTYALTAGTGADDNSKFTISGNQLQLAFTPDYEAPVDADSNNQYQIRVEVTDGSGNTSQKAFTISVNDVSDNPPTDITLSWNTIAENSAPGTSIGTLSTTDADPTDTHTYSLVAGAGDEDNSKFQISGDQLQLNFTPDYENPVDLGGTPGDNFYSVRIRTTDSTGNTFEKSFTIEVTDQNDPPSDIILSSTTVAENTAAGTTIATITVQDQDAGDTHTLSFASGIGSDDNSKFTLSGNQLQLNFTPDYEAPIDAGDTPNNNTYSILLAATDSSGATFEKNIIITVTDVNEAPTNITLSNSSIDENNPPGTTVGTFSATDPDNSDTATYFLVAGAGDEDNSKFQISGNQLQLNFTPDFENPVDLGDTAGNNTYSIRVRVTDGGGNTFEKVFIITINDVPYESPPTDITLSNNSIDENNPPGTTVGTLSTTDPDVGDTHTYSLVSGTGGEDNSKFQISGNQLQLNFTPDFENPTDLGDTAGNNTYSVRVRTTDSAGNILDKVFIITVNNVNEPPTDINIIGTTSVAENTPAGIRVVDLAAVDPDAGDTHTYSLVAGTGDEDNPLFTIGGVGGDELKLAFTPDYENPIDTGDTPNNNTYSVRVRATDSVGNTYDKVVIITVVDRNDAPTDIALSNNTIAENNSPGTTVGTFSTTDQDASDTHTYSLVSGTGGEDNSKFQISGNQLQLNFTPDYENPTDLGDTAGNNTYSVRVRTTDSGGSTFEKVFIITITDANDPPTDINLSSNSVSENTASGTNIATISTTDQDSGDTHTYSLVSGTGSEDNSKFKIVGNNLQLNFTPDYENPTDVGNTAGNNTYSIRIKTTDSSGASYEKVLVITVKDVNESPTDINLSTTSVAENTSSGSNIATITTKDPDNGDTHTYSLVSGSGNDDNLKFTISGNNLRLNFSPNFEKPEDKGDTEKNNTYSIRIRSTDSAGNTYDKVFIINITDVNETPTDLNISNDSIIEGSINGTVIGDLIVSDEDKKESHKYSLVSGVGGEDNARFLINGSQLILNFVPDFENPVDLGDTAGNNTYSVRVKVEDKAGNSLEKVLIINITDNKNEFQSVEENILGIEKQNTAEDKTGEVAGIDVENSQEDINNLADNFDENNIKDKNDRKIFTISNLLNILKYLIILIILFFIARKVKNSIEKRS